MIMGGNSKKLDELREKSTRAILVTQAVNALGYSILASIRRANNGPAADHPFTNCSTFLRREEVRERHRESGRVIGSQGSQRESGGVGKSRWWGGKGS